MSEPAHEEVALLTEHASGEFARRVCFARFLEWKKLLQNTGPLRFRQCGFLDFPPTPGYNFWFLTPGGVAQLGERLNGIQEVRGSIPLASI
jgi:hypothetical protein